MEALAKHKFASGSAQKARLVADQVRGLPVDRALEILAYSPKSAAVLVKKYWSLRLRMQSITKVLTLMSLK